jgi:hypothetical protein
MKKTSRQILATRTPLETGSDKGGQEGIAQAVSPVTSILLLIFYESAIKEDRREGLFLLLMEHNRDHR